MASKKDLEETIKEKVAPLLEEIMEKNLGMHIPKVEQDITDKLANPLANIYVPFELPFQLAKQKFKKEFQLAGDDELWLMVDVDHWGNKHLAEVADQAGHNQFNLAVSNPCFEVWLFLHHADLSLQLIQAKDSPQQLKLADWQKSRLMTQAKRFTLDQLLTLHFKLLTIDEAVKTGRNFLPLNRTLELFLLNL